MIPGNDATQALLSPTLFPTDNRIVPRRNKNRAGECVPVCASVRVCVRERDRHSERERERQGNREGALTTGAIPWRAELRALACPLHPTPDPCSHPLC